MRNKQKTTTKKTDHEQKMELLLIHKFPAPLLEVCDPFRLFFEHVGRLFYDTLFSFFFLSQTLQKLKYK